MKPQIEIAWKVLKRVSLLCGLNLWLGLVSGLGAPTELLECHKIWDAAPHNAFTDLARFDHAWFCVFREGSSHVPGTNGIIRVLRSANGKEWRSVAALTEAGVDLRDPKLSVTPDGRLMLLAGGSFYDGSDGPKPRRLLNARTRTSFSTDGQTWTRWQPVSLPDHEWLWRVTWHGATGYGVSYLHGVPAKDVVTTLWRTRDGLAYERVAELKPPCWPDETTLRFLPDGTMLALVRGEQADRHAFLGRSAPPYTLWTWADTGRAVQGPNFVLSPEGRLITAGRDFPNGQPQTAIGELQEGRVTPLLTLPSGGDCSYPGLGWDDGKLAVSYYSAHEGKTAIYFARVRLPGPSAK